MDEEQTNPLLSDSESDFSPKPKLVDEDDDEDDEAFERGEGGAS